MNYTAKELDREDEELLKRQGLEASIRNQLTPIVTLLQLFEDGDSLAAVDQNKFKKLIGDVVTEAKKSVENIINQAHYWENKEKKTI